MAWVSTAVAVGTAAVNLYQQNGVQNANSRLNSANRDAAVTSQVYQNQGLNDQVRQQEEQDFDTKLMERIKALRAVSTLQAQGRNVSGAVEGTQQDIMNQLGRSLQNAESNAAGRRNQLEMQKRGTTSQAQSRINSTAFVRTNWATELARAGLSIGGAYANQSARSSARED